MHLIATIRRIVDAVVTAVGVVLGLTPDPTRAPVPVPIKRDRTFSR